MEKTILWKDIYNYDNYKISSNGKLLNKKTNKILNGSKNSNGYIICTLINEENETKKIRMHRLVAEAFIENNNIEKNIVNHIDGNKENNNVENLEWCTSSENNKHAFEIGLKINNKNYSYQDELEIIKMKKNGCRQTDIMKKFNLQANTIQRIFKKYNLKSEKRDSCFKNSLEERIKLKEIILNSNKTNSELSKELNFSKEHIGKVRNNKRWTDI